jgi:hypothetical protein
MSKKPVLEKSYDTPFGDPGQTVAEFEQIHERWAGQLRSYLPARVPIRPGDWPVTHGSVIEGKAVHGDELDGDAGATIGYFAVCAAGLSVFLYRTGRKWEKDEQEYRALVARRRCER